MSGAFLIKARYRYAIILLANPAFSCGHDSYSCACLLGQQRLDLPAIPPAHVTAQPVWEKAEQCKRMYVCTTQRFYLVLPSVAGCDNVPNQRNLCILICSCSK